MPAYTPPRHCETERSSVTAPAWYSFPHQWTWASNMVVSGNVNGAEIKRRFCNAERIQTAGLGLWLLAFRSLVRFRKTSRNFSMSSQFSLSLIFLSQRKCTGFRGVQESSLVQTRRKHAPNWILWNRKLAFSKFFIHVPALVVAGKKRMRKTYS